MIAICVRVLDPLVDPNIEDNLRDYGFSIRRDLKNKFTDKKEYLQCLQELQVDVKHPIDQSSKPPEKGDCLYRNKNVEAYKRRFSLKKSAKGKSAGMRFIYVLINENGFYTKLPVTIYSKTMGKKPKEDLSSSENKELRHLVNDLSRDSKS